MIIEWKKLTNKDVSENVIYNALKKINYTSKKKHSATSKQIKKNVNNIYKKLKILPQKTLFILMKQELMIMKLLLVDGHYVENVVMPRKKAFAKHDTT